MSGRIVVFAVNPTPEMLRRRIMRAAELQLGAGTEVQRRRSMSEARRTGVSPAEIHFRFILHRA